MFVIVLYCLFVHATYTDNEVLLIFNVRLAVEMLRGLIILSKRPIDQSSLSYLPRQHRRIDIKMIMFSNSNSNLNFFLHLIGC